MSTRPTDGALRHAALANGPAIAARHPEIFHQPLAQRLLGPAILALVLGLFAYSLPQLLLDVLINSNTSFLYRLDPS